MELFRTGLLVHDDIMDRDTLRRGMPTIHASYSTELEREGVAESGRIGEALGICAGDACYFEAFAQLARALAGNPRGGEIQAFCAEILSEVVVAQMADVRWGASGGEPSEEDILAMYRCKTARYSFSLPLAAGALSAAADAGAALAGPLTALGERLGILFQLRDDELGLFGDESATGKLPRLGPPRGQEDPLPRPPSRGRFSIRAARSPRALRRRVRGQGRRPRLYSPTFRGSRRRTLDRRALPPHRGGGPDDTGLATPASASDEGRAREPHRLRDPPGAIAG